MESLWQGFLDYSVFVSMGVADAGYTGDMSPALPVSVPCVPRTFYSHSIHFTRRNGSFRAAFERTMSRWSQAANTAVVL